MSGEDKLIISLPLPENERTVIARMLAAADEPQNGLSLAVGLAERAWENIGRGESASVARCITAFLLHKQCKSLLVPFLRENPRLTEALFGRLNTYKYSMVFMLKRVMHAGEEELSRRIISLIVSNPFRDDSARAYSEKWSLSFILGEILAEDREYLRISPQLYGEIEAQFGEFDLSQSLIIP